jgi:hypothetical protein
MRRKAAIVMILVSLASMLFPKMEYSATEMGFSEGDPDPNLHRTTLLLGWPLAWFEGERDRRETVERDEFQVRRFRPLSFTFYLLAIGGSFWFYRWAGLPKN